MYFPLEDGSFDLDDDVDLSIIHTVEGPLINDPHPVINEQMKLLFEINEKLSSSKLCGKHGGDEYIFEERERKKPRKIKNLTRNGVLTSLNVLVMKRFRMKW